MKTPLLLIITIILSAHLPAQTTQYPKGVYMSFEELQAKTPSQPLELTVTKRTKGNIKMNGGNDYLLTTSSKDIKTSFIKKEIFAYSTGDSLYLNGRPLKVQTWYSKVVREGKYLIFVGGLSDRTDEMKAEMNNTIVAGALFGAIGGGLAGMTLAQLRYVYALNTQNGEVLAINRSNMEERLLNSWQELYMLFIIEPEINNDVLVKYMGLINEAENGVQ